MGQYFIRNPQSFVKVFDKKFHIFKNTLRVSGIFLTSLCLGDQTRCLLVHSKAYTYNGSQLTQMTKGSDTLRFTYDAKGTPMTLSWNGVTYYYVTNIQGDVERIVNSSGTTVVNYRYDAWGKLLSTTGTIAATLGVLNPLRYRGYVYDPETGLYYVSSRYYDRFNQRGCLRR